MPNALINEKSPYLRQHADNPVDWRPWGEAAFEKARTENKPIFLSIGYSTCHWCHVMAHESFEDTNTAAILNRYFVSIKLDREERPDVDRIYMTFVQATTGSGGWPMSVFLTPDRKPFFGGTYFPPDGRYGRPGFPQLLTHIAQTWQNERAKLEEAGASVSERLTDWASNPQSPADVTPELFGIAFWPFRRSFDSRHGGFGSAPKFPRPVVLNYLLRYHFMENSEEALDMAAATLTAMAAGGMHDQLGGGFHRYSVDERWFVPHFEKMLYDQSQLAISYLEAFQLTGNAEYQATARRIFNYVAENLTSPEGAFYSAEDADSPDPDHPGHSGEGAFYVWRQSEMEQLLGDDAPSVIRYFGVEPDGNVESDPHSEFTGKNILYLAQPTSTPPDNALLERLLKVRSQRPRPHLDSKVLTSWNAHMISAFATGFLVLADQAQLVKARAAFDWLWSALFQPDQRQLLRRFCDHEAAIAAFLDDYAALAHASLLMFEATGEVDYLTKSIVLTDEMIARFADPAGGFFSTEANSPDLLVRMKEDYDGAEPSGNSVATDLLLRLADLLGNGQFRVRAEQSLRQAAAKIKAQPTMAPQMLCAAGRFLRPPEHVIVRVQDEAAAQSPEVQAILQRERKAFRPYLFAFALTDAAVQQLAEVSPFLSGLTRGARITVYRCQNMTCQLPEQM